MNGHDERLLEDVACLALGVLPAHEAARVVDHIRDCEACRSEYGLLRPAADAVGFAAVTTEPADDVAAARRKRRIMAGVRESLAPPIQRAPAAPRQRPPLAAWGVAAAALAAAIIGIGYGVEQHGQREQTAQTVASLRARSFAVDRVLSKLIAPESKHYAVPLGEVVTSGGSVIIALRGLPAPPAGKVYQAWTLASGAKAVAPNVTFVPDATGLAIIELPADAASLAAVAVSVEPAGGSKAPTTKPSFVRKLS